MDKNLVNLGINRVQALYILDDKNRLLTVNEPDTDQITPRLYIMRTRYKVYCYFHYDVPEATITKLEKLISEEPLIADFRQPLKYHEQYITILEKDAPISTIRPGPAYTLPEHSSSGKTVRITNKNQGLLATHFPWTLQQFVFRSPIVAIVEDNVAVAVCFCARKTDKVAEAGVYTMEDYRKRGYAEAVVRDWSIALRETGRMPLYSTSHDNIASQSVARKLGATEFATDFSFT